MNIPSNCNAIMFHHFHDDKTFKKTQGSLDSKSFEKKIKKLIKFKYKIICPQEWVRKLLDRKLLKNELLLRQRNKLPPFIRLISIIVSSKDRSLSLQGAREIKAKLNLIKELEILDIQYKKID